MKSNSSQEVYVRTCQYLIKLIGASVNKNVPDEKPTDIDWNGINKLAKNNSVQEMIYPAVKDLKNPPPDDILKQMKQMFDTTSYRYLMFSMEREALYKGLSNVGISYLPLKGINYSKYYPHPGMRSMSDNDILYGRIEPLESGGYTLCGGDDEGIAEGMKVSQKQLIDLMASMGYEAIRLKAHDEQFTKDVVSFEMHRCLVPENRPYYAYYRNSWLRAVKDDKDPYLYHFSLNDDYIYNIIHIYKHLTTGGIGIRVLVDIYLFLNAEYDRLDFDYIEAETEKLGVKDVEKDIRNLALNIFSKKEFTEWETRQLVFYVSCGVYGNYFEYTRQRLKEIENDAPSKKGVAAKRAYLRKRFSTDEETCKEQFPFFYKHKFMRPFLPFYRAFVGFFKNHKKAVAEIKSFFKTK